MFYGENSELPQTTGFIFSCTLLTLISMLSDLEPIALSYLNQAMQLTEAEIETLSPLKIVKSFLDADTDSDPE